MHNLAFLAIQIVVIGHRRANKRKDCGECKMNSSGKIVSDHIDITVPCKAEYVRTIRRAIADFAETFNINKIAIQDIEIAASEAVANVIKHAYPQHDTISVVHVRCTKQDDTITLEVEDKGCGFNPPPDNVIPNLNHDQDGGLGIILIKTLMDRVCFTSKMDEGTHIKMTKKARKEVAQAAAKRSSQMKMHINQNCRKVINTSM